jgi:drug/metabolite transporter (DMT)-like permease
MRLGGLLRSPVGSAIAVPERFMGIALISFAFFSFSGLDATAKYLGQTLPAEQIVWMRFLTHVVFAVLLFRVWRIPGALRSERWPLQILRSMFLLGSTVFNFFAVRHLQLAETVSIMFAAPFVVTALAGPLLNEWAGFRRWMAIIVGFLGVLVVTRPGLGGLNWAALLSVCSMTCYALYALTTRMLAHTESPVGMLIISAVVATLAITPFGLAAWTAPGDLWTWALLLSTGAWGCIGHFALIRAHVLAPAPVLAPFMYIQILWMSGLGFLVFDDVPGPFTVLGAAIVVSSGLYILYRERKISRGEARADGGA